MAILVPVSMNKQGITITKNKTKYTRITMWVSTQIQMIYMQGDKLRTERDDFWNGRVKSLADPLNKEPT